MPTYDYECQACEHRFEAFHGIKEEALRKCPECGRLKLKRLIGPGGGLIFRGSGFYITDYRSSSYKDQAKKESASETGSKGDSPSSGSKSSDAPKKDGGEKKGTDSSSS